MKKYRVLVCGTTYGQVYLSAFLSMNRGFRLAGILGRGSARTRRYAEEFGVPWYERVADVPDGIDIACVVVRATIAEGQGTFIARELLRRGIHVIQEHPVHDGDVRACLDMADEHRVCYHVNSHYVHVDPVPMFLDYAEQAFRDRPPVFIEATGSLQTAYSLMDIIGRAAGGLHPHVFSPPVGWDAALREASRLDFIPFTCMQGVVRGIPVTLKIQNFQNPEVVDNHFLVMHRISMGDMSGNITLVNTHGPVVWSQGFSIENQGDASTAFRGRKTAFSAHTLPTAIHYGERTAPSLSQVATRAWPRAIHRALEQMREHIESGSPPAAQTRDYLTDLGRAWLDITRGLGDPHHMPLEPAPPPVPDPVGFSAALSE